MKTSDTLCKCPTCLAPSSSPKSFNVNLKMKSLPLTSLLYMFIQFGDLREETDVHRGLWTMSQSVCYCTSLTLKEIHSAPQSHQWPAGHLKWLLVFSSWKEGYVINAFANSAAFSFPLQDEFEAKTIVSLHWQEMIYPKHCWATHESSCKTWTIHLLQNLWVHFPGPLALCSPEPFSFLTLWCSG